MASFSCKLLPVAASCLLLAASLCLCASNNGQEEDKIPALAKIARLWPDKQLNVLIDGKSFNQTELQLITRALEQVDRNTCVKVNKLANNFNPFSLQDATASNFVYVFKSLLSGATLSNVRHPSIGLSSLGCIGKRQSLVLTDMAFRWPELVLRYHLMRTLGADRLDRPDGQVRRLLNVLPLSQKIASSAEMTAPEDFDLARGNQMMAFATAATAAPMQVDAKQKQVAILSDDDLIAIKELYNCTEFGGKLSPAKLSDELSNEVEPKRSPAQYNSPLAPAEVVVSQQEDEHQQLDKAAKQIANSLLLSDQTAPSDGGCQPMEACPLQQNQQQQQQDATGTNYDNFQSDDSFSMRPMILKLDEFHSQDANLRQANQMKLSAAGGAPSGATTGAAQANESLASSYRLMPPLARQLNGAASLQPNSGPKSEMTISFEQANSGDQAASLASTQVLKLCSCSCQTMVPAPQPVTQQPPFVTPPPFSTVYPTWPPVFPTVFPTFPTDYLPQTTATESSTYLTEVPPVWTSDSGTLLPPLPTDWPILTTEPPTQPPPPTTLPEPPTLPAEPTTTTTTSTTTEAPKTTTTTTTTPPPPPPTTTTGESATPTDTRNVTLPPMPPQLPSAACDQVQWVQPNKTVYSSARIVWDVDRGNQNYFLCNSMLNDELVPGKTHGFSCKISQEGRAYEGHSFNVLTKPESVNLAWVKKSSTSFGSQNLPVIGGYSKDTQEPYIVARCLVKDEHNDVITLIGYVNNQGIGWFPFDDIQIECTKYDVLACVS